MPADHRPFPSPLLAEVYPLPDGSERVVLVTQRHSLAERRRRGRRVYQLENGWLGDLVR